MGLKEEFIDALNHPEKLELTKTQYDIYLNNIQGFMKYYNSVPVEKKLQWVASCASYLFGKTCEIAILTEIRPEDKQVWLVPEEVEEGITFDLPKHLENEVIDLMDPYEAAVEEYIQNNLNLELSHLFTFSEAYGFKYALENKLSSKIVGGIENTKVLSNNELYRFGMNAFKSEIEKHGFTVKSMSPNLIDVANALLEKDGNKYLVATSVTILPREGYIADWRANKLKIEAERINAIPCATLIGLIPSNELLASEGIAVKEGEYKVQIKKLVSLIDGEIIE